ncbi:MAG: response regulator [Gallionella sp.]|nr:response regulator [Gallionella sp.]
MIDTYRILLLDDDDFILSALTRELFSSPSVSLGGLEIETFTSPLAALTRAREKDGYFDVVIADNRMPEMSGIDFFNTFREIQPDAVRIILSGHTVRADMMRAINEAHIDCFMSKPWHTYGLKCALVQALRRYELRCDNQRLAKLYLEHFGMQHRMQHKDQFRLMVLDDDPHTLSSLNRELGETCSLGCVGVYPLEVHTFESANAALAAAQSQKFDIVISDYAMPTINGIDLLRQIKAMQPDAVRILLSGVADVDVLINAINFLGINYFVTKPWRDYELRAAIDTALSHYELKLENRCLSDRLRLKIKRITNPSGVNADRFTQTVGDDV